MTESSISAIVQTNIMVGKLIMIHWAVKEYSINITRLQMVSLPISLISLVSAIRKYAIACAVETEENQEDLERLPWFQFTIPCWLFIACETTHHILSWVMYLILSGNDFMWWNILRVWGVTFALFALYFVFGGMTLINRESRCSVARVLNMGGGHAIAITEVWALFFSSVLTQRNDLLFFLNVTRQLVSLGVAFAFWWRYKDGKGDFKVTGSNQMIFIFCVFTGAIVLCSMAIACWQRCCHRTDAFGLADGLKKDASVAPRQESIPMDDIDLHLDMNTEFEAVDDSVSDVEEEAMLTDTSV